MPAKIREEGSVSVPPLAWERMLPEERNYSFPPGWTCLWWTPPTGIPERFWRWFGI
jgi:hypothetical protein